MGNSEDGGARGQVYSLAEFEIDPQDEVTLKDDRRASVLVDIIKHIDNFLNYIRISLAHLKQYSISEN